MHFSDAITEYSFDCKARKLSAKTISIYQKQLRYLQRYLEQEFQVREVEQVSSFHIKQFFSMMDDKGRKAGYINDLLKVFKTFFTDLKKEGYFEGKLPEKYLFVSHRGKQLTQEGITKFMKKAAQETGVNCNIKDALTA